MNLEALITIFETNEMASQPRTVAERLKVLSSLTLSKTLYFGIFIAIIFCLDQIKSDGFRCRKLQNGTDFLLSNETKAANYLGLNFTEIFKIKQKNGKGIRWNEDQVNGLLSEWSIDIFAQRLKPTHRSRQLKIKLCSKNSALIV